jgi:hypothetical protein
MTRCARLVSAAWSDDEDEWTPGDITGMIANPFYAINIDEGLATPRLTNR